MKRLLTQVGYQLRKSGVNALCQLGFRKKILKQRYGKRILLYHGIDKKGRTDINSRFLSVDRFEAQIRFLKNHFNVVPLHDLFNGNIAADHFNVAITFDDGYKNNLELALPILEKYQLHATFFLTAITATDYPMLWADNLDLATLLSSKPIRIEGEEFFKKKNQYFHKNGQSLKAVCKQRDWSFKQKIYSAFPEAGLLLDDESLKVYWQQLSPCDIRQLNASPWAAIGVHAYVHDNLGRLPLEQAVDNLSKARKYLEEIVQHPIKTLAYADGSYTRLLIEEARKMGFEEQYAVDYLFAEDHKDRRMLDRLTINPHTSLDHQVYAILKGRY